MRDDLELFQTQSGLSGPSMLEPSDLEEEWTVLIDASDELLEGAPRPIANDLALSQEPLRALAGLYEQHDWDSLALAGDLDAAMALADAVGALGGDEIVAADARLDQWLLANCSGSSPTALGPLQPDSAKRMIEAS